MHRPPPLAMAILAALLLTAACGEATSSAPTQQTPLGAATESQAPQGESGPPTDGASSPASPVPTPPAAVVEPVEELRFTAITTDGDDFEGASLAGRDAVLWFWASWCTVCRAEAPYVASVAAAAGADVTFVGVAGLGEVPAMQEFVSDYELDGFTHLADVDGTIWQRFGVVEQPAYAFIDDSGTVSVVRGALGEDRLATEVAQLTSN